MNLPSLIHTLAALEGVALTPEQEAILEAHIAAQYQAYRAGAINWQQLIAALLAFIMALLQPQPAPPTPAPHAAPDAIGD